MCTLIGHSRHSSLLEAVAAMIKACPSIPSGAGNSSIGGNQMTITAGLINNTGNGNLKWFRHRFFHVYSNYK